MAATKTHRGPIDGPLRHNMLYHREAIWAAVREFRDNIAVGRIESKTRASQDTIRAYLRGLAKAGFVQRTDDQKILTAARYQLINDCGVDAPRVDRNGQPCRLGLMSEQIWNAMRVLKTFSVQDIVVHSQSSHVQPSEAYVKTYITKLKRAGYLRVEAKGKKGQTPTRYRLIPARVSGPLAPKIQRSHSVFDANLQTVVWSHTDGVDQ